MHATSVEGRGKHPILTTNDDSVERTGVHVTVQREQAREHCDTRKHALTRASTHTHERREHRTRKWMLDSHSLSWCREASIEASNILTAVTNALSGAFGLCSTKRCHHPWLFVGLQLVVAIVTHARTHSFHLLLPCALNAVQKL